MAISTSFSMYVVLGIYNFANFLGLLPFSEALLLSNGTKQVVVLAGSVPSPVGSLKRVGQAINQVSIPQFVYTKQTAL